MMKLLFLAATLLVSTTANATILDFESYTNLGGSFISTLTEDGYTINNSTSRSFSRWGPSNQPQTQTQNGEVAVDPVAVGTIRLVKDDGGLFTVNAIDLGNVSFPFSPFNLTFTGLKADNQSILQSFTLDKISHDGNGGMILHTYSFDNFVGLKELSWFAGGYPIEYGFDNINVTEYISAPVSSVPVPASIWLFAAGLPLIAFKARRK